MKKPIRVGIVGCGNAAVFHYASFQRVTGIPVEVVGVTSRQKIRRMERLGTKQGWSNPAPDEYFAFGYPQEIQDFMEGDELPDRNNRVTHRRQAINREKRFLAKGVSRVRL